MVTRTDIHRPSAIEFNPEDYDLVSTFDLSPEWPFAEFELPRKHETIQMLARKGIRHTGVHGEGFCDHCGARVRYAAIMHHIPTDGYIWIGEQCYNNRFDVSCADFRKLRDNAADVRNWNRKAEKRRQIIAAFSEQVKAAYEWALSDNAQGPAYSIADKIRLYAEPFSAKQESFLVSLHERYCTRLKEAREREARIASGSIKPCPAGKMQVAGTILCDRVDETQWGTTHKMLVETEEGYRLWGSVPAYVYVYGTPMRGTRLTFTATIEPSEKDPVFGFYKRPSKVEVLYRPPSELETFDEIDEEEGEEL